jgi:DtxR family Mn-dependent transcriptional regulator
MAASELNVGQDFAVCGVRDSSSLFLQHLDRLGIELGKRYALTERLEFDRSMVWQAASGQTTTVSQEVASNVLIQRIK